MPRVRPRARQFSLGGVRRALDHWFLAFGANRPSTGSNGDSNTREPICSEVPTRSHPPSYIDLTASRGITALFWFTPDAQPQLLESLAAALQLLYKSECKGFAVIDSTLRELEMYGFL